MESIAPAVVASPRVARASALPWTVSAMLVGSTSIIVGLLWDISWHMTIGRDTFWTPAHMAIYLGGVLAGVCGGWLAPQDDVRGHAAGDGGRGALLGVPRTSRRLGPMGV